MTMRELCCWKTLSLVVLAPAAGRTDVVLPGTQPRENTIEFAKVQQCILCHAETKNGTADPYFSWQGGMMSQSARDPVFRAALTIANQDLADVGDFCLRCHAPRGWLEGRSKPADGSLLTREDMYGVSCDVCHHFVDPLSAEAKQLAKKVPAGYGNAMLVADPENVVRGPYGDGTGVMPHRVKKSEHHATSELCAVCHNVSNPTLAKDVDKQPPHAYGHIERTYSEWLLSDFSKKGAEGTCQSCHYPRVEGGGQSSRYGGLRRDYFVQHGPVGGSTWVQDATFLLWRGKDMERGALDAGKDRARRMLQSAASLKLTFPDQRTARLRITNLTGHKLPTGYPEGRRMWVHAEFVDAAGQVLKEIGRYGEVRATLQGKPVTVPTLLEPAETRVYECLPGMSPQRAAKYGKQPGKSFHFVLNDVTVKDNRIPPQGFSNAAFGEHLCAPAGARYADGQYWDEVDLPVPPGTAAVTVRLMYQSVSWEYLKFLVEENRTDDWGRRLYEAWTKTGKCQPEVMAEATARVSR